MERVREDPAEGEGIRLRLWLCECMCVCVQSEIAMEGSNLQFKLYP